MKEWMKIKFIIPFALFIMSFVLRMFDKDGWWVFLFAGFILFGIGMERL